MNFPEVHESPTKDNLITQVKDVHEFLFEYYRNIPVEFFEATAIPEGWSPRRNLEHIISSNKYFGLWIGAPKLILKIWGTPKEKQLPIEKIDASNRKVVKEYGKYEKKVKADSPQTREKLLNLHREKYQYLIEKIQIRTEDELDQYKAIFGGMSLRTFVYFILKHNLHHSHVVQLRLQNS